MVRADLQCLVSAHDQTYFLGLLVLEYTDVTRTPLLPFGGILSEPEQLCSDLEEDFLVLLVCLCLDRLCELNNRLEVSC